MCTAFSDKLLQKIIENINKIQEVNKNKKSALLEFFTKDFITGNVPDLILHMRKTHSNIYFTLTNLLCDKVVFVVSAGGCIKGNKKRKVSAQAVELMSNRLLGFLRRYNYSSIGVFLKTIIPTYLRTLVKDFKYKGFPVYGFEERKKIPHNGVRGRKIRRK